MSRHNTELSRRYNVHFCELETVWNVDEILDYCEYNYILFISHIVVAF